MQTFQYPFKCFSTRSGAASSWISAERGLARARSTVFIEVGRFPKGARELLSASRSLKTRQSLKGIIATSVSQTAERGHSVLSSHFTPPISTLILRLLIVGEHREGLEERRELLLIGIE